MNDSHHDSPVTADERELFDQILEEILSELPEQLLDKLDEIPLVVEDYPSDEVLDELDLDDGAYLCGLHTGIPLTDRGVEHSGTIPDMIHVYREGVLNLSIDEAGRIDEDVLRVQIRITVLHELGHHFGLDEDDLSALGYG